MCAWNIYYKMKKLLGCLMLAGFFIFLFYAHSSSYGLEQALIGWSLAVLILKYEHKNLG